MNSLVAIRAKVVVLALWVCSAIIAVLGVIGSALIAFTVPTDGTSTIGGGGFPEFLDLLLVIAVAVLLLLTCASVLEILSVAHLEPVPEGMTLLPEGMTLRTSASSASSVPMREPSIPISYACPTCRATVQLSRSNQSGSNSNDWFCPKCSSAHTWKAWAKNKVTNPR